MMVPSAFRIGEIVSEMSMRRPSLDTLHRLEMLDAFTANNSLEDVLLFTKPIRRDEHGNRLPDSFLPPCTQTAAQPRCSTTESRSAASC